MILATEEGQSRPAEAGQLLPGFPCDLLSRPLPQLSLVYSQFCHLLSPSQARSNLCPALEWRGLGLGRAVATLSQNLNEEEVEQYTGILIQLFFPT